MLELILQKVTGLENKVTTLDGKIAGIEDKVAKLLAICKKYQIEPNNVAYIGDDLNDLECMQKCGYSAAPADAVQEVLDTVDYVCKHRGGEGAVREFIEQL